jgi:hypothetical protein
MKSEMKGGKRRMFGLLLEGLDNKPSNGRLVPFYYRETTPHKPRSRKQQGTGHQSPGNRKPVLQCQRPVAPPTEADRLTSGMGHPWSSPGALGTINLAKHGQPINRRCLPGGHGSRVRCMAQLGTYRPLLGENNRSPIHATALATPLFRNPRVSPRTVML